MLVIVTKGFKGNGYALSVEIYNPLFNTAAGSLLYGCR